MDLDSHRAQFITSFADCVLVKGLHRSAIYDLTRHEVHLFPTEYVPVLQWLVSRSVGALLNELEVVSESDATLKVEGVEKFIEFLLSNELVMFADDPAMFPPLSLEWDFPGRVQNAVIDVDARLHDFKDLFSQLDELGCQFVQIRGFSSLLSLALCREILSSARDTVIKSVELIIKIDSAVSHEIYTEFLRQEPLVTALTVHSVPQDYRLPDRKAEQDGMYRAVFFTRQVIDSERHCGVIVPKYLNAPGVGNYSESRLFNGCLNRKISIDATGQIRNCPSMSKSFGFADEKRLAAVLEDAVFLHAWSIRKDDIEVCRGCEFRYVCSDCRAYLEDPANPLSKPLKCGYDPATGVWEPWYRPASKSAVRELYGIPLPVSAATP